MYGEIRRKSPATYPVKGKKFISKGEMKNG